MPERDKPDDYVVGVGERDSAKKFLERLFRDDGIEFEFKNEGIGGIGQVRSVDLE